MPKIIDRPTTDALAPVVPDIEIPVLEPPRTRAPQIFRWLGWLLLVGAVAAVAFLAIRANSDDVVDTPTVAVNLDSGAITADPKPRTPVEPGIVEDATVSPILYSNVRRVAEVHTTFPEESTVSPWLYSPQQ